MTGILILPQRQTALVAKQAASLDVLSGGRLRLGVGLGWNEVEYISLNENFHNRGKRIEEQVALLRRLWTEPLVDFQRKVAHHPGCGHQPIADPAPHSHLVRWDCDEADAVASPAWETAGSPLQSAAKAKHSLDLLDRYLEEAGRPRSQFGLESRVSYETGDTKAWETALHDWQAAGATHLSFNYHGQRLQNSPGAHPGHPEIRPSCALISIAVQISDVEIC